MAVDAPVRSGTDDGNQEDLDAMQMRWMAGATMFAMAGAMLATAPAGADVKAGVDAWGRGDYKAAVAQWRGPALAGDADAEFNLAQAYKLGRGVPVDPAQAEGWFRKAALQGHVQAGDNYGLALFQDGKRGDALPWLEKSANRGEPRAQLVLGTMLFNGDGVSRDYPRAYALMTRASAAGLPAASQTLAQMDQYITADDRARGTAMAQQIALQAPVAQPGRVTRPTQIADQPAPVRPAPPPRVAAAPTAHAIPVPHAMPTPRATPAPRAASAPPAPSSGRYRVQLGAFRERGNAEGLWAKVHGRMGSAQPSYVAAGAITKLQAGGYASKADAERACVGAKAAGAEACVVVAP